jgi:DNA-directed RNA polymerase alpha subunit
MVASVGRKKKDADRVNYNISRSIRAAVQKEADRVGWNEIDMIEDLLKHGLTAKSMLKEGKINYSEFIRQMDSILEDTEQSQGDRKSEAVKKVEGERKIEELELSANAQALLKHGGFHTIADLEDFVQEDLLEIRGWGQVKQQELNQALLEKFGITMPKKKEYTPKNDPSQTTI